MEYKSIQLENVISEIPTEIIESEEIILNKSENRFEIESKDKSCYICGVELQSVDESNVPYIEDSDGLLMLKNANASGQVIDGIRSGFGSLSFGWGSGVARVLQLAVWGVSPLFLGLFP